MKVEVKTEAMDVFNKIRGKVPIELQTALVKSSSKIFTTSKRYAPISPSLSQVNKIRKSKRLKPKTRKQFTMRHKAGALMRSIRCTIYNRMARFYVLRNSEAGAYARRIHDDKGKTWFNRGIGTIAKGPQADEKFIERAIDDNLDYVLHRFDEAIKRIIRHT